MSDDFLKRNLDHFESRLSNELGDKPLPKISGEEEDKLDVMIDQVSIRYKKTPEKIESDSSPDESETSNTDKVDNEPQSSDQQDGAQDSTITTTVKLSPDDEVARLAEKMNKAFDRHDNSINDDKDEIDFTKDVDLSDITQDIGGESAQKQKNDITQEEKVSEPKKIVPEPPETKKEDDQPLSR